MTMKTRTLWAVPLAGALMLGAFAPSALAQKKKSAIPWVTSLTKAKQTAARQKKPIMVDFSADWCPPCRAMKSSTWKDARVIERARRFVPVMIDIDRQPKVANEASVTAVPTIVFYNAGGTEIMRVDGYRDANGMIELMNEAEKKSAGANRK